MTDIQSALHAAVQRHQAGDVAVAEAAYRRILVVAPDHPHALHLLGVAYCQTGRAAEAIEYIQRALVVDPGLAEAHNTLGNALKDQGQLDEAIVCYRRALELNPTYPEAYYNRGDALKDQGQLDEAIASYRRALELKPDYPEAYNNLGNALKDQGQLDEAIASYRRALDLNPNSLTAHSNLIFALDLCADASIAEQQRERRRWFDMHGAKFARVIPTAGNTRDPERRLRIGYVSADYRRHSAASIFLPVIHGHDRDRFEIFCYSNGTREDDVTHRLRESVEHWLVISGLNDDVVAERIRRDQIDILVDLSGHTAGHRLLVFARKPAPVQVTAWGHATGTGIPTIDYFFADPIYVPTAERPLFAEEVIDLPLTYCYEPPEYMPAPNTLPVLTGQPLTFGCVNRLEKITDRAIWLWGRILHEHPESRLLLKHHTLDAPSARASFRHRLSHVGGIDESRCLLLGSTPHEENLRTYHQIDIGLDPFPHGGGISSAEALWMGVPLVTKHGATPVGRLTAVILRAIGLPDWVARDDDEYVALALRHSGDHAGLAQLRQDLRGRLTRSAFGDTRSYTRAVEDAYRAMWRRWCAGHVGPRSAAGRA